MLPLVCSNLTPHRGASRGLYFTCNGLAGKNVAVESLLLTRKRPTVLAGVIMSLCSIKKRQTVVKAVGCDR